MLLLVRRTPPDNTAKTQKGRKIAKGYFAPLRVFASLRCGGFMLLEVVLSVVVIASGLVLVIRSYTTSLKASQVARGLGKASLFLEDKLFEIDVRGFKDGVKKKEYADAVEEDYRWGWDAIPLDAREGINGVNLKVDWKGHVINVSTLRKNKE